MIALFLEITQGMLNVQSFESDNAKVARRSKRSSSTDQMYILIPLEKSSRKVRSAHQQHMVKMDLARTDIPWDVPNSVVLDDGIRKICLDMVTSAPKKRKKSDNPIQYSQEDFSGKEPIKLYPNQLMMAPSQNGCLPPTSSTTPKPPICLNLQIANMITPELACKTKICNNSQIDTNGNVRLNIVFFADSKDSSLPGSSTKNGIPASTGPSTKELTQMLDNARFDSLSKINRWMNSSSLAADMMKDKTDPNESVRSLFQTSDNVDKNSSINLSNEPPPQPVENSFKFANLPSTVLKEAQPQPISNTAGASNAATYKSYLDRGEINTTLALRTLMGLIQLMQTGTNHDVLPAHQDNPNRMY